MHALKHGINQNMLLPTARRILFYFIHLLSIIASPFTINNNARRVYCCFNKGRIIIVIVAL